MLIENSFQFLDEFSGPTFQQVLISAVVSFLQDKGFYVTEEQISDTRNLFDFAKEMHAKHGGLETPIEWLQVSGKDKYGRKFDKESNSNQEIPGMAAVAAARGQFKQPARITVRETKTSDDTPTPLL
jgi:hypothetical protein